MTTLQEQQQRARESFKKKFSDNLCLDDKDPFQRSYQRLHLFPRINLFIDSLIKDSYQRGRDEAREEMGECCMGGCGDVNCKHCGINKK